MVQALATLDLSSVESDAILHGLDEMVVLANNLDELQEDSLQAEWSRLRELVDIGDMTDLSIRGICKTFCGNKSMQVSFPNTYKLYYIASTLAVSTAEVETIFSHEISLH